MNKKQTKTHVGAKKKMSKSTAKNKTNRNGTVNAKKLVNNSSKRPANLRLPANALKAKKKK